MIPYAKQSIDESDIAAVCEVLRSDFLTTGPTIELFENVLSRRVGMLHAVALNSGTAALHAALVAIGIGPGDEVIVPPITFVATANAVIYCGATPVFADVDSDTLLLDPQQVEQNITTATRAIIAVDYAGQPADYPALKMIADQHGLVLISDACHSLGAELNGTPVGALADLTIFSFHPVKPITAGEGGMVITNNPQYAERMIRFRSHGIDKDHNLRAAINSWEYDMTELGYNYRLTDIQCALGLSQLKRLERFIQRRSEIADIYTRGFAGQPGFSPLPVRDGVKHAHHLFVIKLHNTFDQQHRLALYEKLRAVGIGVNVHYRPVYLNSYYRQHVELQNISCPVAEQCYQRILSLPIYPSMVDSDIQFVMDQLLVASDEILVTD